MDTKTIFHCKCEHCGYEWDAFRRDPATRQLVSEKPDRCARCKYLTWNGEDQRFRDPFSPKGSPWASKPVPPASRIAPGTAAPRLQPNAMLEALTEARAILTAVVEDNPCQHPHMCVCREKELLKKMDRQIDKLNLFIGKGKNGRKTLELVAAEA